MTYDLPPELAVEADGPVRTVLINRPDQLNAVNRPLHWALANVWRQLSADSEARVVILTGAGRAFSAGADFGSTRNPAGEFPGSFWERPTVNSFESGWEVNKPVIAAVNGLCLGYGLTLVTWCDFVIASDRATFGYPEVKLGVPTIVGALRLPQRIGWQPAMELLLTGETVSAARAKEIGLALQVVEHDDLLAAAGRFADRLLAGAPLAQRAVKEVARRGPDMSQTDAIRFGETMRRVAGATEDAKEGAAAAREKRPPRWQAR
jgi:enoyl-CoA hydratase/carnithine racemase